MTRKILTSVFIVMFMTIFISGNVFGYSDQLKNEENYKNGLMVGPLGTEFMNNENTEANINTRQGRIKTITKTFWDLHDKTKSLRFDGFAYKYLKLVKSMSGDFRIAVAELYPIFTDKLEHQLNNNKMSERVRERKKSILIMIEDYCGKYLFQGLTQTLYDRFGISRSVTRKAINKDIEVIKRAIKNDPRYNQIN